MLHARCPNTLELHSLSFARRSLEFYDTGFRSADFQKQTGERQAPFLVATDHVGNFHNLWIEECIEFLVLKMIDDTNALAQSTLVG